MNLEIVSAKLCGCCAPLKRKVYNAFSFINFFIEKMDQIRSLLNKGTDPNQILDDILFIFIFLFFIMQSKPEMLN